MYRGFEINQQIVYVGIQKFNTLMNIPKRVTAKSITKKLIDCVNVVDIIVYRY